MKDFNLARQSKTKTTQKAFNQTFSHLLDNDSSTFALYSILFYVFFSALLIILRGECT